MRVHAAVDSGWVLVSHPHLSKSSPHEQPIGTSHLGASKAFRATGELPALQSPFCCVWVVLVSCCSFGSPPRSSRARAEPRCTRSRASPTSHRLAWARHWRCSPRASSLNRTTTRGNSSSQAMRGFLPTTTSAWDRDPVSHVLLLDSLLPANVRTSLPHRQIAP